MPTTITATLSEQRERRFSKALCSNMSADRAVWPRQPQAAQHQICCHTLERSDTQEGKATQRMGHSQGHTRGTLM